MEIYKELNTSASKKFEKLLNSRLSKTKIEEGKIIEGKITKISEKFIFLFIDGLKSEPVLDINELKSIGMVDKAKVGDKISVLLERIENKNGEIIVSALKLSPPNTFFSRTNAFKFSFFTTFFKN